jgi:hypothetical protein
MLNDLAALAPPLLMCAAFLIAVAAFLRHEMRRGDRESATDDAADISPDSMIGDRPAAGPDPSSLDTGTGNDAATSR